MSTIEEAEILVEFAKHVPTDQVAGMVSGIAAYGNVDSAPDGFNFTVRVFRTSKLPRLKMQLLDWERYGFLRWKQHV